ncbi:MAG: hypothetical protein ICV64_12835 [Thermoleophilia bacterium]|nr:hypothetical protein [Thermoleophilia bacterium]
MARMVDQRTWFEEHELAPCPQCKRRLAVDCPDAGAVVCLECGFIGFRAAQATEADAA